MGAHRLMIIFMFIATISIITTPLSYQPQEAYALVNSGFTVTGQDFLKIAPPPSIGEDDFQDDNTVYAFDEKQAVLLGSAMPVDLLATTSLPGSIDAGKIVSASTVIWDPENTVKTIGCAEFDELVIGLQFLDDTLTDFGDPVFGLEGVTYKDVTFRGIEVPPHNNGDSVWFASANSVCFDLLASTPGDTFRVITEGDHDTETLWQIGVFDQSFSEFPLGGEYVGPYVVDNNDTLNNCNNIPSPGCVDPPFTGILGEHGHNSGIQWASSVTIDFDSPSCEEAMLLYSRAGIENDDVFFDGEYLGTINSAEGVYKRFDFDLGQLTEGPHSVTIEYEGDQGFTPETITFEDGSPTELDDVGLVSTASSNVTFKIDDGSNANLTLLPDGIIIERGDPRYGFGSPAGGDQVSGMDGDFSLSNNLAKSTDALIDWTADDYVLLFDAPVDNLRLDVYDFGDFNPLPGDSITLKVYSDAAATIEVGSHTILATNAGDNSIITLSVSDPSDTILSARIIDTQEDIGTAIDNIEFNFSPIPSPDSPDDLHAIDAISLVCWEPKLPPLEIIEIDVKPGSDPSSWSCKNTKGSMPVAVFGSETFDVETINLNSLIFAYEGTEVPVVEVHDKIHTEDKNGDEYPDGVLHLDSAGVCEATDGAPIKETVDVILIGTFGDDQSFEGIGDIRIVKR